MDTVTSYYSGTRDLQHHGLICPPGRITGLYPLNLLIVVVNVKFELDCLLMCRKHQQCKPANFVHGYSTKFEARITKESSGKVCMLLGTGGYKSLLAVSSDVLLKSTHLYLRCIHSEFLEELLNILTGIGIF